MTTSKLSRLIGELVPDSTLPSSEGCRTRISDYRGRTNLVIILAGEVCGLDAKRYLGEVARRYADFADEDAEILVFTVGTAQDASKVKRELHLPLHVFADEQRRVHHALGAHDETGIAVPAVVVADRYGEVFNVWRTAEGGTLPTVDEILDWLRFINLDCPECGVSHWPV